MSARVIGDVAAAAVQQKQQQGFPSSPPPTDSTLAFVYSPSSCHASPALTSPRGTAGVGTMELLDGQAGSSPSAILGMNSKECSGRTIPAAMNNTTNEVAPPDMGTSVTALAPIFQQARDKLLEAFDETVLRLKQAVVERAMEDNRRWQEWKDSVVASFERASSVQRERVKSLSAEVKEAKKLLEDALAMKAATVHDSRPRPVGGAFAEQQAAQEEEKTTKAAVAAPPELTVSSPMVPSSPFSFDTPSAPISTPTKTPASRISLPSFDGELPLLPLIDFSVEGPLAFAPSTDPLARNTAAHPYSVEEGRAAAFEGACRVTSNLAAAAAAADAAVWSYLATTASKRNDFVTATPTAAAAESGVVVRDSAVEDEPITIVSSSDAPPLASVPSTGTIITSVVDQMNDREGQPAPSAEAGNSVSDSYALPYDFAPMVPTSSELASDEVVQSQAASTTSPGFRTEQPAGIAARGLNTKPTTPPPCPPARITPRMPTPSPQTPAGKDSRKPPMTFGTGARRSPLSTLTGNSPHTSSAIAFSATSEAVVSLGGRQKRIGSFGNRRSNASAGEGNGEFRPKIISARSVSIGVTKDGGKDGVAKGQRGSASSARSKVDATERKGARGSSARSAARGKGTPSSTYNLRSRGAKAANDGGAGKRRQSFVFR